MRAKNFEQSLKALQGRRPFQPFVIELVSGSEIVVLHPEAVVTQAGTAVHISPKTEITLFDARSVSRLADLKKQSASS